MEEPVANLLSVLRNLSTEFQVKFCNIDILFGMIRLLDLPDIRSLEIWPEFIIDSLYLHLFLYCLYMMSYILITTVHMHFVPVLYSYYLIIFEKNKWYLNLN